MPITSASRESAVTSFEPLKRSRTIAMATTVPAAAPNPCRMRSSESETRSGASATPTLASTCTLVAMSSGRRRPMRSESGPTTSCPSANPMVVADSVSCTAASVVWNSSFTAGNAGR